ncbi:MAG: hypothetical protein P8Y44_02670, partial [Acidobacteriota bacterium]
MNPSSFTASRAEKPFEDSLEGSDQIAAVSRLRRMKLTFLISIVLLFVFLEFSRYLLAPYLDTLRGRLVMDLVILVCGVFFLGAGFDMITRMQLRLE